MALNKVISPIDDQIALPSAVGVDKGPYYERLSDAFSKGVNLFGEIQEARLSSDLDTALEEFDRQQNILEESLPVQDVPNDADENPLVNAFINSAAKLELQKKKGFLSPTEAAIRLDAIYKEYASFTPGFADRLNKVYANKVGNSNKLAAAIQEEQSTQELYAKNKEQILERAKQLKIDPSLLTKDPAEFFRRFKNRQTAEEILFLRDLNKKLTAKAVEVGDMTRTQATVVEMGQVREYAGALLTNAQASIGELLGPMRALRSDEAKRAWLKENGDALVVEIGRLRRQGHADIGNRFLYLDRDVLNEEMAIYDSYLEEIASFADGKKSADRLGNLVDAADSSANLGAIGPEARKLAIVLQYIPNTQTSLPDPNVVRYREHRVAALVKLAQAKDSSGDAIGAAVAGFYDPVIAAEQLIKETMVGFTASMSDVQKLSDKEVGEQSSIIEKVTRSTGEFSSTISNPAILSVLNTVSSPEFPTFMARVEEEQADRIRTNIAQTVAGYLKRVNGGINQRLNSPLSTGEPSSNALEVSRDSSGNILFPVRFTIKTEYVNLPDAQRLVSDANTFWSPRITKIVRAYSNVYPAGVESFIKEQASTGAISEELAQELLAASKSRP